MGRGKHLTGEMEGHTEVLTHEEVLKILSEMARKGYVTAASVLEPVLRTRPPVEEDVDDEFARILARAVTSRSVYEHRDFGGWRDRLRRLVGGARLRPTREPG